MILEIAPGAPAAAREHRRAAMPRPMLVRSGNPARLTAFVWRRVLQAASELGWSVTASPWSAPGRPWAAEAAARLAGLPERPTARQVAAALTAASPSSVVITADPDPLVAAQADAIERFAGADGAGLCRPAGVRVLLDKLTTRRLCAQIGVPTPPGTEGEAADPFFRAAVADLLGTYGRLVLKGRRGWAGNGIRVVEHPEQLANAWASTGAGGGLVIAEAFVRGQEVSVELIAGREATTVVGWAVKGETGSSAHPVERLRFSPSCQPPRRLATAAADLVRAAGYLGIAEVEYVVDAVSGRFWLLEVNPRTSGVTALLAAGADGCSSLELAMRGETARLAGQPPPAVAARLPAAEFTTAPHLAPDDSRPDTRWVHPSIEGFRPHVYLRGDEDTLLRELALTGTGSLHHGAPKLTRALSTLMDDAARIAVRSPVPAQA
jgi:phosphoribosylaminoimidazole carboxylase (NCAIR synthetase)